MSVVGAEPAREPQLTLLATIGRDFDPEQLEPAEQYGATWTIDSYANWLGYEPDFDERLEPSEVSLTLGALSVLSQTDDVR